MAKKTSAQPTVSVIIPVFNSSEYLQECLDSVYAQTQPPQEIIVINDASTDDSADIIARNMADHPEIVLITNTKNLGQGTSRNNAVKKAKGEYIQFLDSDDTLASNALEITTREATLHSADLVHYGWQYIGQSEADAAAGHARRNPFGDSELLVGYDCEDLLKTAHYFAHHNLYSKEFLTTNKIAFADARLYEDNIFMVQCATHATNIVLIHETLYNLRENPASISRTRVEDDRHAAAFIAAITSIIDSVEPRKEDSYYVLAGYMLRKFYKYYSERTPREHRKAFVAQFLEQMSRINISAEQGTNSMLNYCIRRQIFTKQKHGEFWVLIQLAGILFFFTRFLPWVGASLLGRSRDPA